MDITFDQKLKDYMARKGYSHVVIDVVDSKTCCAGYSEIVTSFATPQQADDLRTKACRVLSGNDGQILVLARGLDYDDAVTLRLKSFLGAKDVEVKGIRAFSI